MTNTEKTERLYALLDEIEAYGRTLGKLNFDMQCCAPEDGMEQAGKDMALVGMHITDITHGEELQALSHSCMKTARGLLRYRRSLSKGFGRTMKKKKT